MDFFSIIIVTCTIVFFICFVCGYCCKRSRRGAVLGRKFMSSCLKYSRKILFQFSAPVTVTTTHLTAAPVEPPYPTNIPHPMPQPISQPVGLPGIGFSNYAGNYQTTSYPLPPAGVYMFFTVISHDSRNIQKYNKPWKISK